MLQWEYQHDFITHPLGHATFAGDVLAARGLQGWELCAVVPLSSPTQEAWRYTHPVVLLQMLCIFRRPLLPTPSSPDAPVPTPSTVQHYMLRMGSQILEVPEGALPLSVGQHAGSIRLYVLEPTDAPRRPHQVLALKDHPRAPALSAAHWRFVGTVSLYANYEIAHVFWQIAETHDVSTP